MSWIHDIRQGPSPFHREYEPPDLSVAPRPPAPRVEQTDYIVGLDLGQAQDYTAIGIIKRVFPVEGESRLYVTDIERVRHVSYPQLVETVGMVMATPPLRDNCVLVVDYTGVGRPVVDMLDRNNIGPLVAITITGGDNVGRDSRDSRHYSVPKRDIVHSLLYLMQAQRLYISKKDEQKFLVFQEEARNFRVKISKQGHDSYGAWREGEHDDIILAVSLACWYSEYVCTPSIGEIGYGAFR